MAVTLSSPGSGAAAGHENYPAAFLSDNGLVFSSQQRHGLAGGFEQELFALGITSKHSRAYHPQTCGKVCEHHGGAATGQV